MLRTTLLGAACLVPLSTVKSPPQGRTENRPTEQGPAVRRITKPGGAILSATAEIVNLDPRSIKASSFDPRAGVLTLVPRRGPKVTYAADPDDFVVAVRTVFDHHTDPSLSITNSHRRGYDAVTYAGPLFKTRIGKVLFETDRLLGRIVFNRDGAHRAYVSEIIPGYARLAHEANTTLTHGARVFLGSRTVKFRVRYNRLVVTGFDATIAVEGLGTSAALYHRPLMTLARRVDESFPALAGKLGRFAEFARLAQVVAVVKWLHAHEVPFDRSNLGAHEPAAHEFPALVPAEDWQSIFNGVTLDGWHTKRTGEPMKWSRTAGTVTIQSAGESDGAALLRETWAESFDVKLVVATKGKATLLVCDAHGDEGARVDFDTNGERREIVLEFRGGAWSVPSLDKSGSVGARDRNGRPHRFGVLAFDSASITLHAAYFRSR